MLRTFNCGIGLVLCVAKADAQQACNALNAAGEQAWVLGQVARDDDGQKAPARVELIGGPPA